MAQNVCADAFNIPPFTYIFCRKTEVLSEMIFTFIKI